MGRAVLLAVVALAAGAFAAAEATAQSRQSIYPGGSQSIYPRSGCSTTSRINPCPTRRLPAPVGDPTEGPLTDAFRRGPLDRPLDPLGLGADLPVMPTEIRPQTLPSQKD